MSDKTDKAPKADKNPKAAKAPAKPKRSWRRRLLRWATILFIIAVIGRIALPYVAPPVVNAVAGIFDLSCTIEEIEISVLGGQVQVWGVEVAAIPEEGEEAPRPYVEVEFAEFDLDMMALLGFDLHVRRMEADGIELFVERTADGKVPLLRHLPQPSDEEPAAEEDEDEEPEELSAIDLTLPLRVDALRAQHVRLHYRDAWVQPAIESWVESSVRISGLGRADRPALIQVHAHAEDLLDSATFSAQARSAGRNAEFSFAVDVRGVNPSAVPGWLAELGLEPRVERLDIRTAGALTVTPHPSDELAVTAEFAMEPVRVLVEGEEHITVDDFHIDAPIVRQDKVQVAGIVVDGVRARIRRPAREVISAFGLLIGTVSAPQRALLVDDSGQPQRSGQPEYLGQLLTASLQLDRLLLLDWRFDELKLTDASLQLQDEVTGKDLDLIAREASIKDLAFGPHAGQEPAEVAVHAAAPSVFDKLRVDGKLWLTTKPRRAEFRFDARRIVGDGLDPYLGMLGLATDLDEATAGGTATVMFNRGEDSAVLSVELGELSFVDGERQLAELKRFELLAGLYDEEGSKRARIEKIDINGGSLPLSRDAEGEFHVMGLKTVPRAPKPAAAAVIESPTDKPAGAASAPAPAPAAPTEESGPPPRIEIGELSWSELTLSWRDDAIEGGVVVDPIAIDGSLSNLAIGGSAELYSPGTADLNAVLRPSGLAEALIAKGKIISTPGAIDLELAIDLRGNAITWAPLSPYLASASLASSLDAGSMRGTVHADLEMRDGTIAIEFGLTGFELNEGESPLLSLNGLAVEGVRLSDEGLHIDSVLIDQPTLHVARVAEQGIHSLGLLFDPANRPATVATSPATEAVIDSAPAPAATLHLPDLPPMTIDRIELRQATLSLRDSFAEQPLDTVLVAGAVIRNLTTIPGAGPTTLEVKAAEVDFLDSATVNGQLEILDSSIQAFLRFDATGLRPGILAGYLPPGIALRIEDGRASGGLSLDITEVEAGGLSIEIEAANIALIEGETVLAGVEEIHLHAPRIDPAGGVITIAETRVAGAELQVTRNRPMAFEVAGIEIDLEALGSTDVDPMADAEIDEQPSAPLAAPASAKALLPTLRLERFELELARLGYVDLSGEQPAQPIELRTRIWLPEPSVLLDSDPEALPPWRFQLAGRLHPLVDAIRAELTLAPWQDDPAMRGSLRVTGIQGDRLPQLAPELGELLAGSDFVDGSFGAEFEAILRVRRKSPLDFDLARGFGAGLEVRDVALRAVPEGEILLGFDSLTVDAKQIHPDAGLHFSAIEVETPHLRLLRDDDGIHAVGLIVPDPLAGVIGGEVPPVDEAAAEETPPAEGPVVEEPVVEDAVAAETAPAEKKSPFADMPEIRVDSLLVQGIDFEFRDEVVDPPYRVPVVGLDVEVARVSTKGLGEGRPLKFTAVVQGGEVELPKRDGEEGEVELRPVFLETAMHGRLAMHPDLDGQVRTALEGLELVTFRGAAAAMGIDLHDGLLDAGIELRFEGERGVHTRAEFTFANLDVAEGENGPIASTLGLPVPLPTVLFIMKDSAEEISLPIDVQVEAEGLGSGAIVSAATSAAAAVIATAIAESPLRVVGGVGGLFGFGGEEPEPGADARTIAFPGGSAALPSASAAELAFIVERLLDDDELVVELRHQFGTADLARAELLANPDAEQSQALIIRLRRERDELIRRRAELTAEIRVAFALGNQGEIEPTQRELRRLLRELGGTEDALDRMLEFTRPNSDRRHDRRTRTTAIGIARQRLETLRLALLQLGGPDLEDRIELRRPSYAIDETQEIGSVLLTPKPRKQ